MLNEAMQKTAIKLLNKYGDFNKEIMDKVQAAKNELQLADIITYHSHTPLDINEVVNELESGSQPKKGKKKPKQDKEEIKYTSLIIDEKFIAEQVINKDQTTCFCVYDIEKDEWNYQSTILHNGQIYSPITDEEVIKGYILLPSEPIEYNTDQELDKQIEGFIHKWLDVDEFHRKYSVYNIRKSWVYERFHTLNYQKAQGEPGVGKSRYLDTIGGLHYKPISTSGATTSAPIFRIINKWKGTLIIDEADLRQSDETNETIKIINQGYEKGRYIMRCDPNNVDKVHFFDAFCPKVLATRKTFDDPATESRCMTVIMKSTMRKDIPVNLNGEYHSELLEIRNKLLLWRFRNYWKIDPNAGASIDLGSIEPRLKQVNVGFISLFIDKPDEIERFKSYLHEYQKEIVEVRSNTVEGVIIKSIAQMVLSGVPVTNAGIISHAQFKDKTGNLWRPNRLSKYMKTLGFSPAQPKRFESGVVRAYEFDNDFIVSLIRKYVFDDDLVESFCNACNVGNACNAVTGGVSQLLLPQEEMVVDENLTLPVTNVTCVTALQDYDNLLASLKSYYQKRHKPILHDELIQIAKSLEVLSDKADDTIKKMLENGDLSQPKPNQYIPI